jgi:hypothetical protein
MIQSDWAGQGKEEDSHEQQESGHASGAKEEGADPVEALQEQVGQPEERPERKKSDKVLFITLLIIAGIFLLLIAFPRFFTKDALSLEEMHQRNLQGTLSPEQGYIYADKYSFVLFDGLWYGLITAPEIEKVYSIPFHYGPREVQDIIPVGFLNRSSLNDYDTFHMLIDTSDEDGGFIGASILESANVFLTAYGKKVKDACTSNDSANCAGRPILACENSTSPVFYFASEDLTSVLYLDKCIIMSGRQTELLRAADRMLFDLLGIMS